MREQLDRLKKLMSFPKIDTGAVSASLDSLPTSAGAEIMVVVAQARRALAKMSSGKDQYKPLLRHAVKRLGVLLEDHVTDESGFEAPVPSPMPLMILRRPRFYTAAAMAL